VEAIKRAREEEPFTSLWDFCERVDCRSVNKKAIEALIKCGAFGSTQASRKGMLEVLESAQAAGSKSQLDAQIGQASIFDLGPTDGPAAFARPSHPPIPAEEFDRPELLAMEKESIGLFITEHPLKRVREAIRAKADCACAEVPERKDGDWIKIGGMVTAFKKIRTRNGSNMVFATLDDLEGSIELVVFEKTLAAAEGALGLDEIVIVRGRVDHKGANQSCVVVHEAERFDPTDAEIEKAKVKAAAMAEAAIPRPLHLRLQAGRVPITIIDELKRVFEDFPGDSEVVLEVQMAAGVTRRLRLGEGYRVAGRNAALKAELDRVLAVR
jgi:DNA polymerase-3 subunit alpha